MKQKQQKWTEAEAREALACIEREGISIPSLAKRLGVGHQRLYYWRHRLNGAPLTTLGPEPQFVEVTVAMPRTESALAFVVHSHGGRKVEIPPGFDAEELRRVLTVVENLPC
jgi:transposase-like protein